MSGHRPDPRTITLTHRSGKEFLIPWALCVKWKVWIALILDVLSILMFALVDERSHYLDVWRQRSGKRSHSNRQIHDLPQWDHHLGRYVAYASQTVDAYWHQAGWRKTFFTSTVFIPSYFTPTNSDHACFVPTDFTTTYFIPTDSSAAFLIPADRTDTYFATISCTCSSAAFRLTSSTGTT